MLTLRIVLIEEPLCLNKRCTILKLVAKGSAIKMLLTALNRTWIIMRKPRNANLSVFVEYISTVVIRLLSFKAVARIGFHSLQKMKIAKFANIIDLDEVQHRS